MKGINKISLKALFIALMVIGALFNACKKDEYYFDGGKSNPVFKGNTLEYLKSKPFNFDTIATIIKLAGMEKEFTQDTITFFAPQDYSVTRLLLYVNKVLYETGKDTVTKLEDIDGAIWRKYLAGYIFKGANKLKDYPQLDMFAKTIYPGQNYVAYNKEVYNIGVIYNDAGKVKYSGYRQLQLSYIPNPAQPLDNWYTASVTSSDIQPDHSVVHVLGTGVNFGFPVYFGFDPANFAQDVFLSK